MVLTRAPVSHVGSPRPVQGSKSKGGKGVPAPLGYRARKQPAARSEVESGGEEDESKDDEEDESKDDEEDDPEPLRDEPVHSEDQDVSQREREDSVDEDEDEKEPKKAMVRPDHTRELKRAIALQAFPGKPPSTNGGFVLERVKCNCSKGSSYEPISDGRHWHPVKRVRRIVRGLVSSKTHRMPVYGMRPCKATKYEGTGPEYKGRQGWFSYAAFKRFMAKAGMSRSTPGARMGLVKLLERVFVVPLLERTLITRFNTAKTGQGQGMVVSHKDVAYAAGLLGRPVYVAVNTGDKVGRVGRKRKAVGVPIAGQVGEGAVKRARLSLGEGVVGDESDEDDDYDEEEGEAADREAREEDEMEEDEMEEGEDSDSEEEEPEDDPTLVPQERERLPSVTVAVDVSSL